MAACVLSGVSGLLPHETGTAIDQLSSFAYLWYGGLIASGALGLVALWIHFPLGMLLERVALLLLAGLTVAFGAGLYALIGWDAVRTGGIVIFVFGVACIARIRQINKTIRLTTDGT